ncbi:hypothetical protein RQP54_18040 [Curvibacter sp. APW13]|uniref:hypothetical protein n=1 Tax=Curvibacter sp. APW13 TaxID=3077236 RepID=UPI0028DF9685|nr:hypothetical protein [Curvibacter sp. APW13]MDT8992779.1 hypothetical protein [Curvibacter sp. APW13]
MESIQETPRRIESGMKSRCPQRGQVERLYAERERYIDSCDARGHFSLENIHELDRLGRVKVASDHWELCSEDARAALRNDPHHQVRSSALISASSKSGGQ